MVIIKPDGSKVIECSMCGEEAEYIATETNEPLCEKCTKINEEIKEVDYPDKVIKYPPKEIIK